jgi:hypothetical protein
MQKIIVAFDGLKYAQGSQDSAIYLAKLTGAHLVGVFLDDPTYSSYRMHELVTKEGVSEAKLRQLNKKDEATRKAAAQQFESACKKEGLHFSIHHDHQIALQDLKHESIYADLLIINTSETLTHYKEKQPTRFIRDMLVDIQCPVLLVPPQFKPFEKLVMLYDGEPASVHAIKMFGYLLPRLITLDIEVVTVNPVGSGLHVPDNKLIREYMKRHYPRAKFTVLKGYPEYEIVKHLDGAAAQSLVVLGANRRGMVSRWFRESMVDILMKEVKLPVFITHNR